MRRSSSLKPQITCRTRSRMRCISPSGTNSGLRAEWGAVTPRWLLRSGPASLRAWSPASKRATSRRARFPPANVSGAATPASAARNTSWRTMQPSLFDLSDDQSPLERRRGIKVPLPDQAARDFASDPAQHVVLEASAGTGKTKVLVDRYVRLIRLGVAPRHILAITFTRKAAAEMRERILEELRPRGPQDRERSDDTPAAVLSEIQVATIDAFCFGLLREFPLEAGVDPGFEIADETEMARFATEALDVTMRIARGVVVRDHNVRLLFTRIKAPVLAEVLAQLLDRRQVALPAVATFVKQKVRVTSPDEAARAFVERARAIFQGREAFLTDGPRGMAEFRWVAADAARLLRGADAFPVSDVPQLRRRLERYFLTKKLEARKKLPGSAKDHPSAASRKRHQDAFLAMAPAIEEAAGALDRDVDGLLARGLRSEERRVGKECRSRWWQSQ